MRLDKFLSAAYPDFSRSYFQHLIDEGFVLVGGKKAKKRTLLSLGDAIEIAFQPTPELDVRPENIPLDILYEDEHLIAINKPAGMVTHPAPGHPSKTFANALLYHCKNLEKAGDPLRPGIVHRLDKDTSGVLLAAKTAQTHAKFTELFALRQIQKTYLAITTNKPNAETVDAPIGRHPVHRKKMTLSENGKSAITHFETLDQKNHLYLVKCTPITGRTHQIRVHLKSINAPVLGDALYGPKTLLPRHYLHAHTLNFIHPITSKPLHLEAPCQDFLAMLCS